MNVLTAAALADLRPADAMDMPSLERELTTLAGHLAAGTCRYLQLLAAFDLGGGWHGTGLRSCAQWLSWRCGLSAAAAREQLRVARALPALPVVTEAFAAGRISFSKARALTRVATAATERDLVEVATASTAGQLDRLCSGIARARTDGEVVDQAARARFTARWEPDGSLHLSGRLAAEDGAALLAALAAVRPDRVDAAPAGTAHPETGSGDRVPGEASRPADAAAAAARSDAAALVLIARHALSHPPSAVGSSPVRLVVHACGHASAEAPDVPDGPNGSDDHDGHDGQHSPGGHDGQHSPGGGEAAVSTVAVLDAGPGIPPLPLSAATLGRLGCEALVESVGSTIRRTESRFAGSALRRALLWRDGGCVFPGCPRRRGLHAHHLVPWSLGGPTSMINMALVCEHHHLLVHEGGWRLRRDGGHWSAVAPDGRAHPSSPTTCGRTDAVRAHHRATLTADTLAGTWAGEHLELGYAVAVLSQRPGET